MDICGLRIGAGNEARTRDLNLGKVALYQLSYSRRFLLPEFACYVRTCGKAPIVLSRLRESSRFTVKQSISQGVAHIFAHYGEQRSNRAQA